MYKLRYFENILCQQDSDVKYCDTFTIWCDHYYPLNVIEEFLKDFSPCNPDAFPSLYWIMLVLSVIGFIISITEFLSIYISNEPVMTLFRKRDIRVLPFIFRRNARLVGSAFMAKTSLFLIYGLVAVSPDYLSPWLTIRGIVLIIEICLWFLDLISGHEKFNVSSLISFSSFAISWLLVRCVKNVFEDAIKTNQLDELKLLPV